MRPQDTTEADGCEGNDAAARNKKRAIVSRETMAQVQREWNQLLLVVSILIP